jgi:hypothetical protein
MQAAPFHVQIEPFLVLADASHVQGESSHLRPGTTLRLELPSEAGRASPPPRPGSAG